jgi:transposase
MRYVRFIATTLGFSSRVYADIFPDEKLPSFIVGVVHALKCYGAVLKHLVPNNLKTVIPKHSKDKLILNLAFYLCYCKETGHNCG